MSLGDRLIVDRVEFGGLVDLVDGHRECFGIVQRWDAVVGHPNGHAINAGPLRLGRCPGDTTGDRIDRHAGRYVRIERERQRVGRQIRIGRDGLNEQCLPLGYRLIVDRVEDRSLVDLVDGNRKCFGVAQGRLVVVGHADRYDVVARPLGFGRRPGELTGRPVDRHARGCPRL